MRFVPALVVLTLAPLAAVAAEPPLAIRNATVETLGAAGRLEKATVVVRDGKIAAVGKDVAVPDDATVIDAADGTLMPGILDPFFEVTVAAATADAPAARAVVGPGPGRGRPGAGFAPAANRGAFTRLADNFYPFDPGYKPLPRAGLTRLNLVTTGAGQSAVVRLTPADPDHMLDKPDGVAFMTVTSSTDSLDQIRTRLEAAAKPRTGSAAKPTGTALLWNDVHDGKAPLVVTAANASTITHLLKAVEPYKNVKLVLHVPADAIPETVSAMKGHVAGVILRPGLEMLPNTRDRFNPARMLHEAGVEFAFSLSSRPPAAAVNPAAAAAVVPDAEPTQTNAIDTEFPLFPVAVLVKTGLPRAAALEALAKKPAAMAGLGATHGTIETGKAADLLLFSGDPLDPAGRLRRTLIDGRTAYAN
jgi:hypothetical protein